MTTDYAEIVRESREKAIANRKREPHWLEEKLNDQIAKLQEVKAAITAELDKGGKPEQVVLDREGQKMHKIGREIRTEGESMDSASYLSLDRDQKIYRLTDTDQIQAWIDRSEECGASFALGFRDAYNVPGYTVNADWKNTTAYGTQLEPFSEGLNNYNQVYRIEKGIHIVADSRNDNLDIAQSVRLVGTTSDYTLKHIQEYMQYGMHSFYQSYIENDLAASREVAAKEAEAEGKQLDTEAMVRAEHTDAKKAEAANERGSISNLEGHGAGNGSRNGVGLTKADHDAGLAHALESSDLGIGMKDEIIPPPRLDDRHISRAINKDAIRDEIHEAKLAGKTSCVVQGSDLEIRGETMKEAYRQNMKVQTPDAATREEYRKAVVSVEKERAAERNAGRSKESDGPSMGM